MKKTFVLLLMIMLLGGSAAAQGTAFDRANRMGRGMNVSYLDNWWLGSKDKHYSDFAKPEDAARREAMFPEIAKAGFKTVRIPICFSAWMELKRPYNWDSPKNLELADKFVNWALKSGLIVIIDLHHTEFDGSVPEAQDAERIVNLWVKIAERYRNTDPERVFFELRNEPHNIAPEAWRWQAEQLIKYVREIAPKHTLIVGFGDWNGRKAMIDSKPFADQNIIYTFHYYDPFLFTHQGATWAGVGGIEDVKWLPFPASAAKIEVPSKAKGQWTENLIRNYREDSKAEKMFADLKAAKDWSTKNKVPIFLGEFGAFTKAAKLEDRCRYAATVFGALGKLSIPNAWWEWDGGFNMFREGTTEIADCMREAMAAHDTAASAK